MAKQPKIKIPRRRAPPRFKALRLKMSRVRRPMPAPQMEKPPKGGILGTGLHVAGAALTPLTVPHKIVWSMGYPLKEVETEKGVRQVYRPYSERLKEAALAAASAGFYTPKYAETPYEFFRSLSRGALQRAGAPPGVTKWGGRVGGFAGATAFDPLAYFGGTAAKGVSRPAVSALRRVARGKIPFISRGAKMLAKQRSLLATAKAPFIRVGKLATKYADSPGIVGSIAKTSVAIGKLVRRGFVPSLQEKEAIRLAQAMNYTAEKAMQSVDDLAKGSLKGIRDLAEAPGVAGGLKRWLQTMRPGQAKAVAKSVGREYGDDLQRLLMRLREEGVMPTGASRDIQGLLAALSDDLGKAGDELFAELQKLRTQVAKGIPEQAQRRLLAGLEKGRPVTPGRAAAAAGLKPGAPLPAWVKEIPPALGTERIKYAKHLFEDTLTDWMRKTPGKWKQFAKEAERLLRSKPVGLPPERITALFDDTVAALTKVKAGVRPRMPITRYLSANEINTIGRKIGVPGNLVLEHAGLAAATQISGLGRRVAFEQAKQALAKVAVTDPALKTLNANLGRFVVPQNIGGEMKLGLGIFKGQGSLKGYFLLRHPGGHAIIDDDLAHAVLNLHSLYGGGPQIQGGIRTAIRAYDKALGAAKAITLHVPPGVVMYNVRNFTDDTVRMIVAAGFVTVVQGYKLRGAIAKGAVRLAFPDGTRSIILPQVKAWLATPGLRGGMYRTEAAAVATGSRYARRWGLIRSAARPGQKISEFLEDFRREAFLLGMLKKNSHLPFQEALKQSIDWVRLTMYAYPEITAFERMLPARIFFFYRFLRHNLPFQVRMLFERPFYQMLAAKAPEMLMGEPMTAEEKQYMPEWIKARMGFKAGGVPGHPSYSANIGLSITDLNKMWPGEWGREFWGALAPGLAIPLELRAGKYFFFDSEIIDRNRLYSPVTAKALSVINPAWRLVAGQNLVKPVTGRNGRKYWAVHAAAMYAISKVRPANDINKLLDPRLYGKGWWVWPVARRIATGGKEYISDIERAKQQAEREQTMAMMRELQSVGVAGMYPKMYLRRGVELTPEMQARVRQIYQQYKWATRRRPMPPARPAR